MKFKSVQRKDGNPLLQKEYLRREYDVLSFTLSSPQTDYDLRANVASAFKNLDIYSTIDVLSDQDLSIKFNDTNYPVLPVSANRHFNMDNLMEIVQIYLSNASGQTANITIIGVYKG